MLTRAPTHIRRRTAGFSLVELMIVVALIGIMAAFAVTSFTRNQTQSDADNWIRANRDAILTASRRAVATRNPYMVEFTATTVQWCQVVNVGALPGYIGVQTTCVGLPATTDQGNRLDYSSKDTRTVMFAGSAEMPGANNLQVAATRSVIATGTRLYFGRNGSASTNIANVMTGGLPDPTIAGFTLYTRRRMQDDLQYRRRLAVLGVTGRTRIFDRYD